MKPVRWNKVHHGGMSIPPDTDETLVSVADVVFDYDTVRALSDVTFDIEAGMVVALVGPNGAGKTTLMRSICALEHPTMGTIRVAGVEVRENPREVHRNVGFLPDFFGLYDELTVEQSLLFHAGAKKLPREDQRPQMLWAAEHLGLSGQLDRRVGELSRGNRQKVAIAQAIIHKPRIALLDEPASGLDPDARRHLSETIRTLNQDGMTFIVSSHILSELEDYSSHVLIVRDGQIDAFRPLGGGGQAQTKTATYRIALSGPDVRLQEMLAARSDVDVLDVDEVSATCVIAETGDARQNLLRDLVTAGLPVTEFADTRQSVSDVYFGDRE